MASIIHLGGDKYITADRIWRDNGSDAEYAMMGGQKVLIAKATRGKPVIAQVGNTFVYMDGKPVNNAEDVSHLTEPFRSTALKFIKAQAEGGTKAEVPIYESKEKATEAAMAPKKKGPGRPKKVAPVGPKKIMIDSEEMLQLAVDGKL